jgi:hypothetical protein
MFILGLILPLTVVGWLWVRGQMSVVGKLAGTGLMVLAVLGPAIFAQAPADSILHQGGFWVAARALVAIGLLFWTKLSEIHI